MSIAIMTRNGDSTVHALPDERMECVGVGHPADEAGVGGQRNDSIACNAQVTLSCGPVIGQHVVHQAKQLHDPFILPQILVALHSSDTVLQGAFAEVLFVGVCISRVLCPGVRLTPIALHSRDTAVESLGTAWQSGDCGHV